MSEIYFTGIVLLLSIIYTINAMAVRVGSLDAPGPGFLPLCVGIGAIILSLIILVSSVAKRKKEKAKGNANNYENKESLNAKRIVLFVIGAVIFIAIIEYVGFLLASSFMMIYFFRIMGIKGWVKQVIYGLLSSGIAYLVFVILLDIPFPKGFLM